MIRKFLSTVMLSGLLMLGFVHVTNAQSSEDTFFYDTRYTVNQGGIQATPVDNANEMTVNHLLKQDIATQNKDTVMVRILKLFNMDAFIIEDNERPAFAMVVTMINFALTLTGLIALIVLIYAFSKMFFSGDEDGIGDAKKVMINVFIAIAIIAVSAFIVNFLFYLATQFTEGLG